MVRRADREQPVEVARDQVAGELRLARAHPVAVALDGVDLAVVRDEAVRVRQRPRRERVGREARVHQRERAGEARVGQVGEERRELTGGEHALVDDGARRQAREVDAGLALAALAQRERQPVELDAAEPCRRRRRRTAGASRASTARAVGPTQRRVDRAARASRGRSRPSSPAIVSIARIGGVASAGVGRQERDADGVVSRRRAARSRRPRAGTRPGPGCRMPAPSPESGSAPEAPRCSRLSSTVRPCSTICAARHAGERAPRSRRRRRRARGAGRRDPAGPGSACGEASAHRTLPSSAHSADRAEARATTGLQVEQGDDVGPYCVLRRTDYPSNPGRVTGSGHVGSVPPGRTGPTGSIGTRRPAVGHPTA